MAEAFGSVEVKIGKLSRLLQEKKMRAVIDGSFEIESVDLDVGGWVRQTKEKAGPGTDGVISVDMGRRQRAIKQRGVLRAVSRETLESKTGQFEQLADGKSHTLSIAGGKSFERLRIDKVVAGDIGQSGAGSLREISIVYTQLSVNSEQLTVSS